MTKNTMDDRIAKTRPECYPASTAYRRNMGTPQAYPVPAYEDTLALEAATLKAGLSHAQANVYRWLLWYSGPSLNRWAGPTKLAADTGVPKSTLCKLIGALLEIGIVFRSKAEKRYRASTYSFLKYEEMLRILQVRAATRGKAPIEASAARRFATLRAAGANGNQVDQWCQQED